MADVMTKLEFLEDPLGIIPKVLDLMLARGIESFTVTWQNFGGDESIQDVLMTPSDDDGNPTQLHGDLMEQLAEALVDGAIDRRPAWDTEEGGRFRIELTVKGTKLRATSLGDLYGTREVPPWRVGTDLDETNAPDDFNALLDRLKKAKVKFVHVAYAGGGDSGGYENIDLDPSPKEPEASSLVEAITDFLDSYSGAPGIEENNEGGRWEGTIDVKARTLTFTAQCDFEDTSTPQESIDLRKMPKITYRRCELCGRAHPTCKGNKARVYIQEGLVPVSVDALGVLYWAPQANVEDSLDELRRTNVAEAKAQASALRCCKLLNAGTPPWAIPALAKMNTVPHALLRLALDAYPYTGAL